MFANKSILARLLANENITVTQGNFSTASFNVESRTLCLPMWKEMSTDVYDLLVGHEVAHALYTPREDLQVVGVPFSFVNVVEDIRIEKKILRKYPGLVSNFSRGYLDLIDRDIFGTAGKDLNKMHFMDRLNLKAKGRQHVDIKFSEEEQYYFDLAMSVETFDDVKQVVVELAEWLKAKQEENPEQPEEITTNTPNLGSLEAGEESAETQPSLPESQGEETNEATEESPEQSPEESTEKKTEESSATEDESEEGSEPESESDRNAADGIGEQKGEGHGPSALAEVSTDVAQHENEAGLVDSDSLYIQGMSREHFEQLIIPYKELLKMRRDQSVVLYPEEFVEFQRQSKPIVNMMVKEFEMRKAAYRNIRARTSPKGTLDVNKLHSYKYNDQLFKQVTKLADGKDHGMIMLIDYSGSMNGVLGSVIEQTINLVQFCKRVNIPFRVLAFTSDRYNELVSHESDKNLTTFDYFNLVLLELFNSKMSKSELEYAMQSLYARKCEPWYNFAPVEDLGSTPLNAAILATQHLIEDFRKEHPVHKLNLVTLTDGASNSPNFRYGFDCDLGARRGKNSFIVVKGKKIDVPNYYQRSEAFTAELLNAVAGRDVKTINYFIADRRQIKGIISRDIFGGFTDYDVYNAKVKEVRRDVKANGVYVNDIKKVSGYDRQFIMVSENGRIVDSAEEFEIPENATTRQLAKAFAKYGDSKKKSRIVTRKFAEIVA